MTDEEKKKKEQEEFDKLFNDLFKVNSDKDIEKPEQNSDVLDDDFLQSIFDDNKDKPKSEEKKQEDNSDDNFDWLKELIDEIDQEEQDKRKHEQNTAAPTPKLAPPPPPKPVKPSFTSKLKDKPRAPKPPEHIRVWGSGKKIVRMPVRDNGQDKSPDGYKRIKYFVMLLIVISISSVGGFLVSHYMIKDIQTETCKTTDVIMKDAYTGDKILINTTFITKNGKKILEQGYIDAHISSLMYNLIKPGEKVIDIGAGFGYYTLYLARLVQSSGKVYAFEARECMSQLLEGSIKINDLYNVEVFNKVLFSENIEVLIDTKDYQKASSFGVYNIVLKQENIYDNISEETVHTSTLDSNLHNMRNISLININANGHELSIILGAKNIISNSPNIKIITTWSKYEMGRYVNVQTIVQQLLNNDFKFWFIKPSNGQLVAVTKLEDIMQIERGRFLIARSIN
jgi:FkbM family methyltransferase